MWLGYRGRLCGILSRSRQRVQGRDTGDDKRGRAFQGAMASPPGRVAGIAELSASSFTRSFGNDVLEMTDEELQSGGVATADVDGDGDGDVDFYVVGGNTEPNHFYRNRGDSTFEEVGAELGLDLVHWGSGPAFGDIDGRPPAPKGLAGTVASRLARLALRAAQER